MYGIAVMNESLSHYCLFCRDKVHAITRFQSMPMLLLMTYYKLEMTTEEGIRI
jgi:hypothetical protein